MIRKLVFKVLRLPHLLIDRKVMPLFSYGVREKYIITINKLKAYLFPAPSIPEWAVDEMRVLGRAIDPAIYPSDTFIATCLHYGYPINPKPGYIYEQLIQQCSVEHYAFCFAIPWLKHGGADLVTLKHIEVAHKKANGKVLVILTEPTDSPWLNRIPEGVDVLNVSAFVSEISNEEMLIILSRLLVQLQIDVLHIINSRHVWEIVRRYGLALQQRTKIFVSLYCDDYDKYGQPVGFARQYLGSCYKHITKVFSDNSVFPELLHKTYGYPLAFFKVIKVPAPEVFKGGLERPQYSACRVLWSGRLDRQKRPDILLAVAKLLPDVSFTVYGAESIDAMRDVVIALKKLENVKMMGVYNGAESLPFSSHDVFLYTSQWDGMPNMILEAISAGIPVVASCVGGVSDAINEKTGFLIRDIEDVSLYVKAIRYALENPSEAERLALAARKYVETEHTLAVFESGLFSSEGYFGSN